MEEIHQARMKRARPTRVTTRMRLWRRAEFALIVDGECLGVATGMFLLLLLVAD
jgi:hypothetical protein